MRPVLTVDVLTSNPESMEATKKKLTKHHDFLTKLAFGSFRTKDIFACHSISIRSGWRLCRWKEAATLR